MIEIPQEAREGVLQILPRGTTYFDEARRRYLLQYENEEESQKRLDREARMLDDRIIQAHNFRKDDAFIRIEEFKNFLFNAKQNELSLQMALGDTQEKVAEMLQKLEEYDPASETLTLEECRELVRMSGMLLFPGWEINSSIFVRSNQEVGEIYLL